MNIQDLMFCGGCCRTKAGYISSDLSEPLLSAGKKQGGIGREDVVGGNCIHPMCLDASLKRSLKQLKLETVSPVLLILPALPNTTWYHASLAFHAAGHLCPQGCSGHVAWLHISPHHLLCRMHGGRWTSYICTTCGRRKGRWVRLQ